jgi:hypothetical protein
MPLVGSRLFIVIAAFLVALSGPGTPRPDAARRAGPIVVLAANQSFNWAGYNQGALSPGRTFFHQISAEWTVPTARQHRKGEEEFSAAWIGIGGGCLNPECTAFDTTLIQAGTLQHVHASGVAEYATWWEAIPGPLMRTELAVSAGDRVRVEISEGPPEVWHIHITNRSTGQSFSLSLPYSSTHGTAEWIVETPVVVHGDGTITVGPMPELSVVRFDYATTNGSPATLAPHERMELVDFDLKVLATPSLPDREFDGFDVCVYKRNCKIRH